MNYDLRAVLIGVEQKGPPRGLLAACLIAKAGVAGHQRLEYLRVPVDESLFAEITKLLAALSHAEILRVPVGGLLIRLKARHHFFDIAFELRTIHTFEPVLLGPVVAN